MFQITFIYDELSRKWIVICKGAISPLEALQGFNAVILTVQQATPRCECNKATLREDGSYEISVGV